MKALVLSVLLTFAMNMVFAQAQEYIQLRKYTFDKTEQLQQTEAFIENIYLPELKKKGYSRVGVFRNHAEESDTALYLYLLLPIPNPTTLYDTDIEILDIFPEEKHYARVENVLLKSFQDMPMLKPSELSGPRKDRIYELRSYESPTDKKYINKVDMFNAGGEVILFEELGFNAVFYGEVIAGSNMPNLMYMTTHANQKARDDNWKAFVDAPKWKEISSMPKYQKNVSHIDIHFLYPTSYSDY
ncbi:NIPSNAP family protein [Portibacter marinus]|uniref:NIPSNAP family protein n=1 Tax=Portibacter marinus TaxID=2898660 RepID=UPI001F339C13|nr:NIPSNAP family protein [Portibacter marinus]